MMSVRLGGIRLASVEPPAITAGGQRDVVFESAHLGVCHGAHSADGGGIRSVYGAEYGAGYLRGHGQTAAPVADEFVNGVEHLRSDARICRHEAHESEQRGDAQGVGGELFKDVVGYDEHRGLEAAYGKDSDEPAKNME